MACQTKVTVGVMSISSVGGGLSDLRGTERVLYVFAPHSLFFMDTSEAPAPGGSGSVSDLSPFG